MREKIELANFVKDLSEDEYILVTLTSTEGSTYRKKGAMKVVSKSGKSCGLISGGCLEKTIVDHALSFACGQASGLLTLDTTKDTDRLFGTNIGCQGILHLDFQNMSKDEILSDKGVGLKSSECLSVLVFGAGPDVTPLSELLKWQKWNVKYFSPSSELVEERLQQGWRIEKLNDFSQLNISDPSHTAVVLMSHHYPYDLEALSHLVKYDIPYIGLLGPLKRKEQLISDLKKIYDIQLNQEQLRRLHGPIGLQNMGQGESAIALSILAQLQSMFFGRESVS